MAGTAQRVARSTSCSRTGVVLASSGAGITKLEPLAAKDHSAIGAGLEQRRRALNPLSDTAAPVSQAGRPVPQESSAATHAATVKREHAVSR